MSQRRANALIVLCFYLMAAGFIASMIAAAVVK